MEKIRHAAVLSMEGKPFVGKCHGDCFYVGKEAGVKMSSKAEDQGFITTHGRYVSRVEAAKIAFLSSQIDRRLPLLFSEDLWSEEERGKFDYLEGFGYVKKEVPGSLFSNG